MFGTTMCWTIVFHIHNLPLIWNHVLWTYNCKLTFMVTYALWKIQTFMIDKINACMQIWSNHCKTTGSWCTKIGSKHICQLKVFTWYSPIQIIQAIIFTCEKCEDTTHEMNTTIFASKCLTFSWTLVGASSISQTAPLVRLDTLSWTHTGNRLHLFHPCQCCEAFCLQHLWAFAACSSHALRVLQQALQ